MHDDVGPAETIAHSVGDDGAACDRRDIAMTNWSASARLPGRNRSIMSTVAPACRSVATIASPIPLVPPVTSARFPLSSRSSRIGGSPSLRSWAECPTEAQVIAIAQAGRLALSIRNDKNARKGMVLTSKQGWRVHAAATLSEGTIMLAGLLALTVAALFAGAAVYVNLVEQPARLGLDDRSLLIEWKPAYKRGFAMQAPLAIAGCVLGLVAWWQNDSWPWLLGAIVIVANWPLTLLVIRPTNNRLMEIDPAEAGAASRTLIRRWGRLHALRTALGFVATIVFLWAALH
jgi:hypothetical protein